MKVESCSVCLDDLDEHVEATYCCKDCGLFYCSGDGKRHAKKHPDHVLEELKISPTTSSFNNLSLEQVLIPQLVCNVHSCPINTYCKTCQDIICPSCALDVHKAHDCHLIDQIYMDEKMKFRVDLETLKKRVLQFESMIGGSEKLNNALVQIEAKKINEEEQIDILFDGIINKVNNRREYLKKALNDLSDERTRLIIEILQMKQIIEKDALGYEDKLEELSKIDLIKTKINFQKKINTSYDKMLNNMKFSSVEHLYNFCLESDKNNLKLVLDYIENLGKVNSTLPSTTYLVNRQLNPSKEIIPDEFYYDRDNISKEANLFKKTSYSSHSTIMSSKKISQGVVEWRVNLAKAGNWVGVGVCQQFVYESKDYSTFKTPFLNHGLDIITTNGYVWTNSDRTLNNTLKGFKFINSEEIFCEVDCNTNTLTIRQGHQKFSMPVQLPVYPVIVLLAEGCSASIHL